MTISQPERWQRNLGALRQYVEREGTASVPQGHVERVGDARFPLGRWMTYVHQRDRAGKLAAYQKESLASVAERVSTR